MSGPKTNSAEPYSRVPKGSIIRAVTYSADARVETAYTGNLRLALVSGANLSIPVEGWFDGQSVIPYVRPR
jgi:hypothetical protein